jgi:hypothetical protein
MHREPSRLEHTLVIILHNKAVSILNVGFQIPSGGHIKYRGGFTEHGRYNPRLQVRARPSLQILNLSYPDRDKLMYAPDSSTPAAVHHPSAID